MDRKWISRIIQVAVISLTVAAVFQELEKPKEERTWHGKIAGFIPYDFRIPTLEKLKEAYWNPYERKIITPEAFGIGWGINFYTLLENLGMIKSEVSEENFLMPTESIKDTLANSPAEVAEEE
jgi:hypothetical protein|tara:strand:+ start:122 stop:490 length:369 start_codon:yes stop_codon:yes gene_type:complete